MKKRLLISLVGILMLISVLHAGIIDVAAVSSQQTIQLQEGHSDEKHTSPSSLEGDGAATVGTGSPIHRAGTVPTVIVVKPTITEVHVGETLTANGTLIDTNTGKGIPNATLLLQVSFDGSKWTTVARVRTDYNGSVSYTGTIPDPQLFGYQAPLTVYGRVVYPGDEMYAGAANTYRVVVLPAVS